MVFGVHSVHVTSNPSYQQAAQIAVLRDELDAQELEGQAVIKLLDQSAEVMKQVSADPHLGQLLDVRF